MTNARKLEWLNGGGAMSELIAAMDWARSPLGPIESWPQSLRTTVSLCLASNFPINIIWGESHNQIYNDGYRVVCGAVHPRAMGEDYRVTWESAWPAIGRPFERALAGETTYLENQRMFLERNGYFEETFFTFSLSPIRDESGRVVGLFHPVTETTATMLAERRTRALRDIADSAGSATVLHEAADLLLETLSAHPFDVPLALLYLAIDDGARASLRGAVGVARGGPFAPETIPLGAPASRGAWPLSEAAETSTRTHPVEDLEDRFGRVVTSTYPEPLSVAFVFPIRVAGVEAPLGFLVMGASPRLPLDERYRAFMEMLGAAASAALGNARAYEAERRRAEALAEIDRAKTAFFSNVSHEFRTPLTLLLGPIEGLLGGGGGPLPDAIRAELEVVHRNALRLLKLVNAVLDFSRNEAGRAEASFEAIDLAPLTREVVSSFESVIARAGLSLVVDVEPSATPVSVDRDMWEKIVLNLLSNAFKFTERGEIRVTLRSVGGFAELSVADTGIGIPEGELGNVFKRFHRVQGAKGRSHEGSGIGLALVHDLARLHGGSVELRSVAGEGSTFLVRVPSGNVSARAPVARVAAAHLAPDTARAEAFVAEALRWLPDAGSSPPRPSSEEERADRPRILLADDNADMRDYVRRLLDGRYHVTAVTNGAEALRAATDSPPDLILSDLMMPVMDGAELVRRLRADDRLRTLPVILLSARAGEEATASGLELGADDYLTKPFSTKELLARVKANLAMAALRTRVAQEEARGAGLARQQQWIEGVLDRLPVATLLVDPDSLRCTFANRAARALTGVHAREELDAALESGVLRFTDEHDRPLPPSSSPSARLRRREPMRDVEGILHAPAGRSCVVIDSELAPPVGELAGRMILTLEDVSRLKRAEAELKVLLGARDEFLVIASHELKTPITSLALQLQMAERSTRNETKRPLSPERLARTLRASIAQVDRLTTLVDDLIDVARVRSGTIHLALERVDLARLVREAMERRSLQLAQAGCTARVEVPPNLVGTWDARRLEQVLGILVSNAVRHAAGNPLHVTLSDGGDEARLEVRDFGPGIPEAQRETIFERFDRGVASPNAGGLGLGLFISRQLVIAHHGTISLESPAEGGARFVVALPREATYVEG